MPLKDEKDLLKEIQKLERAKRQIDEYKAHQELMQEKKVCVSSNIPFCIVRFPEGYPFASH